MRATAKAWNWKLTGKLESCADCQMSNAKQKPVAKKTKTQASNPGERIFIDTSSVSEHTSLGGARFWLAVVDDATGKLWSFLIKKKEDVPREIITLVTRLNDKGRPVKYIRLDDAGENKKLEALCRYSNKDHLRTITFEFTSRDSPQFNGKVESKIAVGTRRAKATLNGAKLPKELRSVLWGEAIKYHEDIENTLQSGQYEKPPFIAFGGYTEDELRRFKERMKNRRSFGEIGYVKTSTKIKGKLEDRGTPMMYLGPSLNHATDSYRMLNLETKGVSNTRDVTWLNKVYGEWKGLSKPTQPETIALLPPAAPTVGETLENNEPADPQKEVEPAEQTTGEEETEDDQTEGTNRANPRLLRELAALDVSIEDIQETNLADRVRTRSAANQEAGGEKASTAFTMIDRFNGSLDAIIEYEQCWSARDDPARYKDLYENPKTFKEAWDHEDPFQRKKWREAIGKEFVKMKEKKVWRKIKRKEMEEGRRCVKHKWVFEIKRDGRFRARLVACGYSQIPGTDFDVVYSAVANDISFRILVVIVLVLGLRTLIFDVETAFLIGDLDVEIYMDCPEGMEHEADECLLLVKTIYGLVQSARMYYEKFAKILRSIGFVTCQSDPCLFVRFDEHGPCFVLCYVDDNLVAGSEAAIKKLMRQIEESELTVTTTEDLRDYLSCDIQLDLEETKGWIGQPHMVKKIVKTFGEEVSNLPRYATPGTPNMGIVSPKEGEKTEDAEKQSRYRSGVGMLMYLIKHSRPDIANAVREMTKVLGKATPAAYKEMLRCIKFVIDTKDRGLKLKPSKPNEKGEWKLEVFSDSDWAGSKDDRRSVSSHVILLNEVPIAWRSRSQKVVSLSSSEAEFYAMSEQMLNERWRTRVTYTPSDNQHSYTTRGFYGQYQIQVGQSKVSS